MRTLSKFASTAALALATTLVFSCSSGDDGTPNNGGNGDDSTLTITDIPATYNGKYAYFYNERNPHLIGCQNVNVETETTITLVQISNGRVNLPMWIINNSERTITRYSGNDVFTPTNGSFVVIGNVSSFSGDVNGSKTAELAQAVAYIDFRYQATIAYSNGNATISANDGTLYPIDN